MRRLLLVSVVLIVFALGSTVGASSFDEAYYRDGLTDCALVAEAQVLGVSTSHITQMVLGCRRFRAHVRLTDR